MAITNSASVSLKLLIDTKSHKVLFAEASKEVVDFLFSFLSLHVLAVTRLLSSSQLMVCNRISESYGIPCPQCRSCNISTPVSYVSPSAPTGATSSNIKAGYVKGGVIYMIMDNLDVKPMTTESSVAMLQKFNPRGYTWFIDHYNSLIDELVENGITPYVTLLYFDLPQGLEDKYLGPLNRSFVDDFKAYTEICSRTFGDRVKNWITINEQLIIAKFGYGFGIAGPGRCSISAGFPCIAPAIQPLNLTLRQSFCNCNDHLASMLTKNKNGDPIGSQAEGNSILYIIYPQGVKKLLEFMNKKYRNPIIYITENGITEPKDNKLGLDAALKDPHRIENNLRHLFWITRIPKESAKWLPKFVKG
ncbi:unnamed protein product [Prunus armeniaca]